MGQAKLRGSFEQRKAAAVELARVRDEAALQARMEQRSRQESAAGTVVLVDADMDRLKLIAETIDRSLANPGVIAVASGK